MNIKKLFKSERGTHKGKVKVTRDGKTFYREQMIGRKKVPDIVGFNISPSEIKSKKEMDKNIDRLISLGVKPGDRVDLGNDIGVFKVKKINIDGTITCGEGFGKRYPASIIKKVI